MRERRLADKAVMQQSGLDGDAIGIAGDTKSRYQIEDMPTIIQTVRLRK
jgi:hypothetical protein